MNAEIIAIGSELLTPNRIDTNSLWLTEQLNRVGIEVRLKTVVGDDELRLEEAVRDAVRRSQILISTGGLGPTEDDITRKVAGFKVAIPSWGVGTGGTRFGRFPGIGEPRNVFEKLEDCAVIHRLTGASCTGGTTWADSTASIVRYSPSASPIVVRAFSSPGFQITTSRNPARSCSTVRPRDSSRMRSLPGRAT